MTIPHPQSANGRLIVQVAQQRRGDVKGLPTTTLNILYLSIHYFCPLQKPEQPYDQNTSKMHSQGCRVSGHITVPLE
jgi:hypothetical protein